MKREITAAEVRALFDYNAEDGHLRWRVPRRGQRLGAVAGSVGLNGYRRISFWDDGQEKNICCLAHRLVWLWVHGEWPSTMMDHINMNKDDNRLVNLRLATMSQNKSNQRIRKDSKTGFKGVLAKGSGWSARIQKDGVTHYLGTYPTPEQAHLAYCNAAKTFHGEFARSV